MRLFRDREDAGLKLAEAVAHLRDERPIVLGLPRGGVPVAFEVARALQAPTDISRTVSLAAFRPAKPPRVGTGSISGG
jgi:putative phosphoribosyl transferase